MAPTHMEVPTGSFIRLLYEASAEGIVPVLAVKLQEMFGMQESPAIAEGKVPVLVHLLSPAGRPLQITRDLKGFSKRPPPFSCPARPRAVPETAYFTFAGVAVE